MRRKDTDQFPEVLSGHGQVVVDVAGHFLQLGRHRCRHVVTAPQHNIKLFSIRFNSSFYLRIIGLLKRNKISVRSNA